jgi:hypothetical protein
MIYACLDNKNSSWTVEIDNESTSPEIQIGFVGFNQFLDLFFGWEASKGDVVVGSASYPEEGIEYIFTDQDYISSNVLHLNPDDEVVFKVWAKNNELYSETVFNFIAPRPPQPYPSWSWDSEQGWTAPVPRPEGEDVYFWDEKNQQWVNP